MANTIVEVMKEVANILHETRRETYVDALLYLVKKVEAGVITWDECKVIEDVIIEARHSARVEHTV